jgi:hypothetical protein
MYFTEEPQAIDARDFDIRDYEVETVSFQYFHCFSRIGEALAGITGGSQEFSQHVTNILLIINNQDFINFPFQIDLPFAHRESLGLIPEIFYPDTE